MASRVSKYFFVTLFRHNSSSLEEALTDLKFVDSSTSDHIVLNVSKNTDDFDVIKFSKPQKNTVYIANFDGHHELIVQIFSDVDDSKKIIYKIKVKGEYFTDAHRLKFDSKKGAHDSFSSHFKTHKKTPPKACPIVQNDSDSKEESRDLTNSKVDTIVKAPSLAHAPVSKSFIDELRSLQTCIDRIDLDLRNLYSALGSDVSMTSSFPKSTFSTIQELENEKTILVNKIHQLVKNRLLV